MKPQYKNINRYFKVIQRSLFRIDGKLSYQRILEAFLKLADVVHNTETDETVWYIGKSSDCTLDSMIVGAYWFMADYHGGQASQEYRVLSALGEIFRPGCECGPEDESTEKDVYEALEEKSGYKDGAEDD